MADTFNPVLPKGLYCMSLVLLAMIWLTIFHPPKGMDQICSDLIITHLPAR
jgi:hypothetical protein